LAYGHLLEWCRLSASPIVFNTSGEVMSYQDLPIAAESDLLDLDLFAALDDALESTYLDEWRG